MDNIRNVVIIGGEDTGKTTLANALLGWDVFPQSYEYVSIPTTENASQRLTEAIQLTDTPGYSLLWKTVPEAVNYAVSRADTIVVLLSEELAEDDVDIPSADPEWEERRGAEATLLRKILENAHTRDIYFVIPYDTQDWPEGQVPLRQALCLAGKRFASMSAHGTDGFFCVDPMKALIGAIEADDEAVGQSGILPLKAALLA